MEKLRELFRFFKTTDIKIFKLLGKKAFIRNGVGYDFISDDYLYDNCYLEIGIGRVRSGRGDWGGGFDYATDSPLKITIDKNRIIKNVKTASFYNSKQSQKIEKIADKIKKNLSIGSVFIIKDKDFENYIDKTLKFIPCKRHIGWDVFESPHMIDHFLNIDDKNRYNFRDPKNN